MKKASILIFSLLVFISCGKEQSVEEVIESRDLQEIRAKKTALSEQQSALSSQIAALDAAIDKLDTTQKLALVDVRTVSDSLFRHFVELPGDVQTDQNIIIYPEFSGILRNVYVNEGDRVQKGQILAKIDEGGLGSQLAQLEAQAALAETTFDRQQRLWEQNIGSEIQFLEAKTNYEAIQNSVEQLRSQLAKTVVRAPFSGIIDQVISEEGEVVAPGQSRLFRLINLSDMYITVAVPESYLSSIEKGTEVLVEIPAVGSSFTSKVRQVGNFVNPNNRTFEIQIDVPGNREEIKPNLIATVKLNDYSATEAIIIPENVMQKNSSGENVVFIVKKKTDSTGITERRIVETGKSYDNAVEILSGLSPGDLLVMRGARSIQEGEQVMIESTTEQ